MTDEQNPPADSSPLVLSRQKVTAFLILFVVISGLAIFSLYVHLEGTEEIPWARFADPSLLFGLLALLLVYYASDGLRLLFVLRALNYRLPAHEIVPLVFINFFVSNVTPMATGGGVAQVWYLRRHKVPVGVATAATTLRTLLAVVFIFVPTPLLLIGFDALNESPVIDRLSPYLAAFACIYLLLFYVLLFKTRWLAGAARRFIDTLNGYQLIEVVRARKWRYRVMREIIHFSSSFRAFFTGRPSDIVAAVFFTVTFLLSLFSFPALILWGIGHPVDYLTSLAFLVVTTFVMYFSPTPGASGIAEATFVIAFRSTVEPNLLLATIVAWRFFTIYLGMLIGIPVTWKAVFLRK